MLSGAESPPEGAQPWSIPDKTCTHNYPYRNCTVFSSPWCSNQYKNMFSLTWFWNDTRKTCHENITASCIHFCMKSAPANWCLYILVVFQDILVFAMCVFVQVVLTFVVGITRLWENSTFVLISWSWFFAAKTNNKCPTACTSRSHVDVTTAAMNKAIKQLNNSLRRAQPLISM